MPDKSTKHEFYLGNPNLPNKNWKGEYTRDMIRDLKKSRQNLLYFAENFFYIIDPDSGKVCINLFPYQKRILRTLRDNRKVILLASRQCGKALDVDTPIKTPQGWTTMGALKTGDQVYGLNGMPCNILKAHDVLYDRDCYEIEFDNGEKIVADSEHNWFTQNRHEIKKGISGSVKTTLQIIQDGVSYGEEPNHRIPTCLQGLQGDDQDDTHKKRNKWNYIKKINKVSSRPVRCITVDSEDSLYLCGKSLITTHNTTCLTIYALWIACFNDYQNIVIVANKEATAIEIFRRVRLAYEELPNFIKPGVKEYAKTSCEFENGSRISISTTTGSAARGQSINCLLIDECAFIEPESILEDFWRSVFPTLSRSKKSKVLIASTPNGTGNLFYRLCDGSEKEENGFVTEKVPWYDVPGRDEKWKKEQIKALGSIESFLQEFEIQFLSHGDSSIDDELFYELSQKCTDPKIILEEGNYKIWEEPNPEKIYVAGVDISEGVGIDASVVQILDITDPRTIRQVAVYHNRQIPPLEFSNKLHSILRNWGSPIALIERNNCGAQVVDRLVFDVGYEKVVSYGAKVANRARPQMGMIAHTNTKYKGVVNMRYFINEMRVVEFADINTLKELKEFVRYPNGVWKAKSGSHDDRVMALLYALYILEKELTERYFEVLEVDDHGKPSSIKAIDFGVSLFENPTSIYLDNEIMETAGSSAIPAIVFGMGGEGDIPDEIAELELEGWTLLH
jgi:hypothetical protein